MVITASEDPKYPDRDVSVRRVNSSHTTRRLLTTVVPLLGQTVHDETADDETVHDETVHDETADDETIHGETVHGGYGALQPQSAQSV